MDKKESSRYFGASKTIPAVTIPEHVQVNFRDGRQLYGEPNYTEIGFCLI